MAVVSLFVLWQLAKSSLGPSWGIPAVALCTAEPMFFSWSHIPRPEMMMTAIFLLAIFCGMKALDKMGKMWPFLAALLGTLAIDVHLPGVILAPSIAIALILCQKKSISFRLNLICFIIGAFIGLSWYLTWHVIVDPQLYSLQWEFHFLVNKIIKTSVGSLVAQIPREYLRYYQWFWGTGVHRVRLFEGILILCGIIIQIRSTNVKSRYISITTLSLIVIMGLTVNRKVVYYLLPLYPLFVLHALAALQSLVEIKRFAYIREKSKIISRSCRVVGTLGLVGLFVFYFSQDLIKLNKFWQTDYDRYIAQITTVIPAGVVVAGSPSLWYSFGKRNNLLATVSVLWAIDYNKFRGYPETSAAEIMRQEKIEFVVIEPFVRKLINSQETASGSSLMNFLHSECKLLKAFRNEKYIGIGECPEGELTEVFAVVTQHY
jgi:4-amino-4-deoxy-L-arabinose transferase-like glycosyltransferase